MTEGATSPGRRLALVCGGPSAEHRISLLSCRNVEAAALKAGFTIVRIGVGHDGCWRLHETDDWITAPDDPARVALAPDGRPVTPARTPDGARFLALDGEAAPVAVDTVFPIMHGPFGEDGTAQAALEAAGFAYVGCRTAAAAACMDKDHAKAILRRAGVPVVDWITARRGDDAGPVEVARAIGPPPWFVKPANMGSSVGISRVGDDDALPAALAEAYEHDAKALIEPEVRGRELECAVLGNETPDASGVGEIAVRGADGFYSYAAKYLEDDAAELRIDAGIEPATRERIRETAVSAFRALGCRGLARVDFFLEEDGRIHVNELNTMPGFTRISMYPKLWEAAGLPPDRLVERLVGLAHGG
jgi:D-alanine-D-alanine ligase